MTTTYSVLAVFGSGGHTMEMLELLRALPENKYTKRTYVVANTDHTSEVKARTSGVLLQPHGGGVEKTPLFYKIPRAREVGQSYITSIWTTLVAFIASFRLLFTVKPDLLLVNGPGTCLPICIAAWILKCVGYLFCCFSGHRSSSSSSSSFFFIPSPKIVFVESVCRVKKLSMTGKILYTFRIADAVHVQWKQLQDAYPRTTYVGIVL